MRPAVSFTGTISSEPEIINPGKGKPFLSFGVESPDSYSQYPNRVKVCIYDKDLEAAKGRVFKGAVVSIQGDGSVDAYISTRTNKAAGMIRIYARAFEVFGGSQDTTHRQQTLPSGNSASAGAAPAKSAPVTQPLEDDVPF